MPTVEELYGEIWADDATLRAELDRSLDPRPPESLYEAFAALGVAKGDVVLDAGCGYGAHSVELDRRFDCDVVAVDIVPHNVEKALERVAEEGLEGRVRVVQGSIEALPLGDNAMDHVWCRDMLNHVRLRGALAECARVLRPGGGMLVFETFATNLLEPGEAERLCSALAIVPESMSRVRFEELARETGFAITSAEEIDSEWREHRLEAGDPKTLDDVLRAARLRRREAGFVERYGRGNYDAAFWGLVWGVYQLLGKLCPTVYVLENRGA